ncbi:MAG: transporter substrate-binding domain-containing protein, partial [bacterium]|nr:transporter substrate-binding domain-containing protein [bacterium]
MKFPAILVLMLLVVIVCPTWAAIGDAHADGTLRVLAYDLEPFFYVDAAGDPGGLEYEILHAFATRHGLELRIIWVAEFQELIPKLRGGEGDMISAGMTITEKRREIVDFSASYFPNRVVTVVSTAEGGRLSLA